MDVDGRNFSDALAILESLLPKTDFVAFDLEFSGLGDKRPCQLDTPKDRYETARQDASVFAPLQFGLVLFRRPQFHSSDDTKTNGASQSEWLATPFNFNLFPRAVYYPQNSRYPLYDRVSHMQSSAVHFLNNHGFDFTKCLSYGLTWLRSDVEKEIFDHIEADLIEKHSRRINSKDLSAEDKAKIGKQLSAIETWINSLPSPTNEQISNTDGSDVNDSTTTAQKQQFPVKMFELPQSARERKLVFDGIRTKHPNLVCRSLKTQNGVQLRVERFPTIEQAKIGHKKVIRMSVEDIVRGDVQFRLVIDALRKYKTKLVGHNCLLDITKTFCQFVDNIPETLEEFKGKMSNSFGKLMDTRWIFEYVREKNEELKKTTVEHGIEAMEKVTRKLAKNVGCGLFIPSNDRGNGFIMSENDMKETAERGEWDKRDVFEFHRYVWSEHEHEAGYDAWMTGRLFISLQSLVNGMENLESQSDRIYLGACGGYKYIDMNNVEKNDWDGRNGVVVQGKRIGRDRDWQKSILTSLLIDTDIKEDDVERVTISWDRFIALLRPLSEEAQRDGLEQEAFDERNWQKISENAAKNNIVVQKYVEVIEGLTHNGKNSEFERQVKKRRMI